MNTLKYLLVFILLISSCTSKNLIVASDQINKMPARKIVKKHVATSFASNTLDAKIKVNYISFRDEKQKKEDFTVRLRMKKDSLIWIKGTKVLTAFKIKITPNSLSYYLPISKEYFEGDLSLLSKLLGIKLSFEQLQNLFIGKSVLEMKGKRFDAEISEQSYLLTPKAQEKLFDVIFKIHPKHFKLDRLFLERKERKQTLEMVYGAYSKVKGDYIPTKLSIYTTQGKAYTKIRMEHKSLKLNQPVQVRFRIPAGYKRIEF